MREIKTIEEMLSFIKKSRDGERAVYYRGFLYDERQDALVYFQKKEQIKVADIAYRAYEQSLGTLVQKRNGDNDYSYIFQSYGVGRNVGFSA